jgi:FAD/FMN-containing dehydrogenase
MAYSSVIAHSDELVKIFGRGRVFFDKEIRQLYNHDLSNPPWVIDYLIRREPDAVVLAETRDQIVHLLKFATAFQIPVTPAAGRTSAYGGAVPVKGGIVLDLSRLKKEIQVDVANLTVTTDPAVVILDLDRELNRYGLQLATYPTSAPSATIGGFVCQGGVGMGAFRHGAVANQVLAADVVLPNGDVKTFTGNELDVVNECSGITGIVTKLTLKVVKKAERVPVLAAFDTMEALHGALTQVAQRFNPWNLTWHNPTFSQLREEAGGPKTVPRKKWSLLAVFDAPDWEKAKAEFAPTVEKAGGKMLPDATAKADWGEIFNTLRAKALGPSIAPGEAVFPLHKMPDVLQEVGHRFDYAPLSMEGTIIQGGHVTLLAFALDDERRPEYPLGFAAGINLVKIAKKNGGRAYAPGLYLAAEAPHVFGSQRYGKIKAFKKAVDRSNILNPGKIIGVRPRAKALLLGIPPLPAPEGSPMSTVDRVLNAAPMVWAMTKLAPLMKYNRPAEDRAARPAMAKAISAVQGSTFGKKHDWSVYSCSQCMFCRNASPLGEAVGFEAGSPSGLIWWARLYLKGQLEPTKRMAELVAAASETPVGDEVCPSRIPLSQVFKDWRVQLEHDAGRSFQVPPALRDRVKAAEAARAEQKKRWETPVAPPAPPAPAVPEKKPAAAKPAEAPKPAV